MSADASRGLTGARKPESGSQPFGGNAYENLAITPPEEKFSNGSKENDPAQKCDERII